MRTSLRLVVIALFCLAVWFLPPPWDAYLVCFIGGAALTLTVLALWLRRSR